MKSESHMCWNHQTLRPRFSGDHYGKKSKGRPMKRWTDGRTVAVQAYG